MRARAPDNASALDGRDLDEAGSVELADPARWLAMAIAHDVLATAILDVLRHAAKGKGTLVHYLTAYQILSRLPEDVRAGLIAEYGEPGRGAGKKFTAVSRVAQIARDVAEFDYLDAKGLAFELDEGEEVTAGYPVIGIYRVRR